jgi:hypothetical protein
MGKSIFSLLQKTIAFFLLSHLFPLSAFEKIPSQYHVTYGSPSAPIQVTEYFSLSCLKCLVSYRRDFKDLKAKYIDANNVYWTFHLNPADLLTLQAMVCLEKLSLKEKRIFWEVVLDTLDNPSEGATLMQIAMETLGKPIPQLQDISYLQSTSTFKAAFGYLKQSNIVTDLPTVEINGVLHDEFPTRKFLEKQLSFLTPNRKSL